MAGRLMDLERHLLRVDHDRRRRGWAERRAEQSGSLLADPGRLTHAGFVETPVAGEAPSAVDEHADADPLALDVVDPVDATVPGRDGLRTPHDRARVSVGRTCRERRSDGFFAERSHAPNPNASARIT